MLFYVILFYFTQQAQSKVSGRNANANASRDLNLHLYLYLDLVAIHWQRRTDTLHFG